MDIISIEGNIGVGKSTIIEKIRRLLNHIKKGTIDSIENKYLDLLKKDRDGNHYLYNDVEIITEPVDKWLKLVDDVDNENILEKKYKNQERWSYSFQMNAFSTRTKDILEHSDKKIVILERSVLTDRNVFAKLLFKDKKISTLEWKLYNEWFEWLTTSFNITPSKIIYLKATPEISFSRIKKRSRVEEDTIPFEYIKRVSEAHDEWLLDCPILTTINADKDFELDDTAEYETIKTIFEEINKLLV